MDAFDEALPVDPKNAADARHGESGELDDQVDYDRWADDGGRNLD
jgi:hypothetical protein